MNGEWTILLWILVGVVFLVKIAPVRRIVSTVRQQPLLVQIVAVLTLCLAIINGSTKTNSQNSASQIALPSENYSSFIIENSSLSSGMPTWWNDDDTDTDADGIPDLWEKWTHGNRYVEDSAIDRDEDSLTDLEEFQNQTDPRTADTDGDGFSDAFEVSNAMNPTTAEDFTPVEPDADQNGRIDLWENAPYYYGFTDTDHDGFDDYYELEALDAASDENFDVVVTVYTSRSAVLTWDGGANGIVVLPTTGQAVRLRLPFGVDSTLNLLPSPTGTEPPSGELWKSRMRLSFSPRSGQNLYGNALVSPDGMIAHKVVNLESEIDLFSPLSPTSGFQTLSLTGGGSSGPSTEIKAGKFEVYFLDKYHGLGDTVGAFTVTNHLGMGDAIYDWSSAFGDMDPDSGMESWLTVTRVPGYEEEMTIVTATELDSETRVAVTSIVEQCSQRVFSASISTNNFSPQLFEEISIGVTVPGCEHFSSPEWLEIEVVRETIGATQHVASVDMEPGTPSVDRYLNTSALGGQTLSFVWDGIAQVGLPLADHPDVFNGPYGSIHRAMPDITSEEPVPPPFYTVRVRHWNTGKTEVLNEYSETVFIPQVVLVYFAPAVASLLVTPLVFTNADNSATTVYSGVESEEAAEQILQNMPQYIMAFMPEDVNIRFVNRAQPITGGGHTDIMLADFEAPVENALGECLALDRRNSTHIGLGIVYAHNAFRNMHNCYRYRQIFGDVFTVPLSGENFASFLSVVAVHETGHVLGLVDPEVLKGISSDNPHNMEMSGRNIMDECLMQRMSDILSPSKTRYWKRDNRHYMEFCLPKKKWSIL